MDEDNPWRTRESRQAVLDKIIGAVGVIELKRRPCDMESNSKEEYLTFAANLLSKMKEENSRISLASTNHHDENNSIKQVIPSGFRDPVKSYMNVMPTMQRQASATETANDLINNCIAAASRDSQELTAGCRQPLNPVEYSQNSTHSTHLRDASNCEAPTSRDTISNSQNTRTSHRGDCTICFENPVNSVLYRCGHMCMCHDCAMEHFNVKGESICPVCRAPVDDIIQTFMTT